MEETYPRRYQILTVVMLGSILGPLDGSILNVILPTITRSFAATMALAEWVPMVYLLTIAGLVLLFGRLGDIVGYRRVFLTGLLGFVAASVLCATSPTMHTLVAFRAVQGVAAGMMMAVPLAILTRTFPASQRGRALGLYAISISVGLAVGPSLGGFLTALVSWRAAFLINVPVGLLAFVLAVRVLPEMRGRPGHVDVPGVFLALSALSSFLLFVTEAQQDGLTPFTVTLLLVAVVSAGLFVRTERRSPDPMLPLDLFRNPSLSCGALASLFNFMGQFVVVFLTPFFLQRVLEESPGRVGLVMTAFPLAVLCVAPASGALSDRIGTVGPAVFGMTVSALSCGLLATLPADTGAEQVAWRLALFGLGAGIFGSPNNSAVMGSAPREHLGVVSSLLGTVRTVGMVLGVAAGAAVLYALVPQSLLRGGPLSPEQAAVYLAGLRYAYAVGGGFAVGAALLSLIRGWRSASFRVSEIRDQSAGLDE
jgi:EmrB/QacA subfamily drug resistance transporter